MNLFVMLIPSHFQKMTLCHNEFINQSDVWVHDQPKGCLTDPWDTQDYSGLYNTGPRSEAWLSKATY